MSQPRDSLAKLKWQLHAGAAWIIPDLNSEAMVYDLLHQCLIEACLLDKVQKKYLKGLATLKKVGADTLLGR